MQRYLALSAALALLAGCAANTGQAGSAAPSPGPPANVLVIVTNRSNWDMDVFLVRGGGRSRIGLAPGNQTTRYSLTPAQYVGGSQIRILAVPIVSGRAVTSEPLTLTRGNAITLDIPPQ